MDLASPKLSEVMGLSEAASEKLFYDSIKGELLKELSDSQKATILYDALPNYYIKKMKEANTEPIKMNLKELF
jgi:hypothetical protein